MPAHSTMGTSERGSPKAEHTSILFLQPRCCVSVRTYVRSRRAARSAIADTSRFHHHDNNNSKHGCPTTLVACQQKGGAGVRPWCLPAERRGWGEQLVCGSCCLCGGSGVLVLCLGRFLSSVRVVGERKGDGIFARHQARVRSPPRASLELPSAFHHATDGDRVLPSSFSPVPHARPLLPRSQRGSCTLCSPDAPEPYQQPSPLFVASSHRGRPQRECCSIFSPA